MIFGVLIEVKMVIGNGMFFREMINILPFVGINI
jgi:hypothetical protein